MPRPRAGAAAALAVAVVALLPFAPGLLLGRSLYFRDLALHFLPLRLFALEGLRAGELRYWNPLLHEGVPTPFPPVSYPLELLQLAWPTAAGISGVLVLHVPLAALALFVLARGRGLSPLAAAGGALAYALGGFALSSLNLYVYVHALAWAPLVVWALGRAAAGGRRDVARAALVVAVAASTLGAEVVAQSLLFGLVLAFQGRRAVLARLAGAVLLGLALAAPSLLTMQALVAQSQRGGGFAAAVTLAHSVHPLTWPQVLVAAWHGDPGAVADVWWGSNFFPRGFPYILSLYLGATVLALALAGACARIEHRGRLLALAALAALVCLGRYAGLEPLVEALPPLRAFRYPVKAFFTLHLAVALLAAHGLHALEAADARATRRLAFAALGAGGVLVALGLAPIVAPGATRWFLAGFLPPGYDATMRQGVLRRMIADAAQGGVFALAAGLVAALAAKGRVPPPRAALTAVVLLAADLLRAGAGLNAYVEPSFFRVSPELTAALPSLREGRLYTCPTHESPAYFRARAGRARHELWTFATHIETLTPETNLAAGVPTAYSEDFTSLVPPALVPRRGDTCAEFSRLADRLRRAGVGVVLSLDPLASSPALEPRGEWRPARIAPLAVRAYALRDPWPRHVVLAREGGGAEVGRVRARVDGGDRVDLDVEAAKPALLVVRDGYFPGWKATVNGVPAPVVRVEDVYRGVPLEPGASAVSLRYQPPGLRAGLLLCALAGAALAVLARPASTRTPAS